MESLSLFLAPFPHWSVEQGILADYSVSTAGSNQPAEPLTLIIDNLNLFWGHSAFFRSDGLHPIMLGSCMLAATQQNATFPVHVHITGRVSVKHYQSKQTHEYSTHPVFSTDRSHNLVTVYCGIPTPVKSIILAACALLNAQSISNKSFIL